MKIQCVHGYFKFSETYAAQISRFASQFGLEISRSGDHFTFDDLIDAPEFSIAGGTYLGAACTSNFEGQPWEVMRANDLVYDFSTGTVVSINSVTTPFQVAQAVGYFVTTGMIQPGSVTEDGLRVTDYAAFWVPDRQNFKYSEITYG